MSAPPDTIQVTRPLPESRLSRLAASRWLRGAIGVLATFVFVTLAVLVFDGREGPGSGLTPDGRLLVPDELPPMEYRPLPAGRVVKAEGAEVGGFPEGGPARVPPRTKATLRPSSSRTIPQ